MCIFVNNGINVPFGERFTYYPVYLQRLERLIVGFKSEHVFFPLAVRRDYKKTEKVCKYYSLRMQLSERLCADQSVVRDSWEQ